MNKSVRAFYAYVLVPSSYHLNYASPREEALGQAPGHLIFGQCGLVSGVKLTAFLGACMETAGFTLVSSEQ